MTFRSDMMMEVNEAADKPVKHIINELELILSEKRTALSVLRTGIAVILLPLSVLTLLLATSRYYDIKQAWDIAAPLGIVCLALFGLGLYLIIQSAFRIRRYDRISESLLKQSQYLRELMDI